MDQVNTKATFAQDDLFERKRYMDVCMKLIENHPEDRGACTIAVDAPWGVGKSTFLWMWINELAADDQPVTVYYNAWENDQASDALTAILWAIFSSLSEQPEPTENVAPEKVNWRKGMKAHARELIGSGATIASSFLLNSAAANQLGNIVKIVKDIVEGKEPPSVTTQLVNSYESERAARKAFREHLAELATEAGKLIIFIDELDRCKPSFAIETLEAIKHYFDVPGMSFVFGVDMTQLGHAIGGRYGNSMDTGGYLSKFFDHQVRLSKPTARQMINAEQHNIPKYNDNFLKPLSEVFSACRITPREISGIIKHANTIWQYQFRHLVTNNSYAPYITIVALLGMKTLRKEMYDSFLHGNIVAFKSEWEPDYPSVYYHLESVSRMCNMPDWQVVKETSDILNRSSASSLNEHTASLYRMCYHLADDEESSLMLFRDKLSNLLELTV